MSVACCAMLAAMVLSARATGGEDHGREPDCDVEEEGEAGDSCVRRARHFSSLRSQENRPTQRDPTSAARGSHECAKCDKMDEWGCLETVRRVPRCSRSATMSRAG